MLVTTQSCNNSPSNIFCEFQLFSKVCFKNYRYLEDMIQGELEAWKRVNCHLLAAGRWYIYLKLSRQLLKPAAVSSPLHYTTGRILIDGSSHTSCLTLSMLRLLFVQSTKIFLNHLNHVVLVVIDPVVSYENPCARVSIIFHIFCTIL